MNFEQQVLPLTPRQRLIVSGIGGLIAGLAIGVCNPLGAVICFPGGALIGAVIASRSHRLKPWQSALFGFVICLLVVSYPGLLGISVAEDAGGIFASIVLIVYVSIVGLLIGLITGIVSKRLREQEQAVPK
jgi:hypothetical protein